MNCKHEFSCGVCSECGIAWSVYAEQSIKERDSLKSRLAKLEEIADEVLKLNGGPIDGADTVDGEDYVMVLRSAFFKL